MKIAITTILNVIRYIFGIIFVLAGIGGITDGSFISGLFMVLFGASLTPIFYKTIKFKYAQIVLPVIFFITSAIFMPPSNKNTGQTGVSPIVSENKAKEKQETEVKSLSFAESEIEMDIKENKEIILKVSPDNAETEYLEFHTSDEKIALAHKKATATENKNEIILQIKAFTEGNCEIFAKSKNVQSNKIKLKIIDKERIETEEKARKEAEEAEAKRQAEEQAKKEAEEKTKQQSANKNAAQSSSSSKSNTKQKSNANNSHGKAIYCTPHGKRYHYDPDCGGKNSRQTTLEQAKSRGLTPCQKCVH